MTFVLTLPRTTSQSSSDCCWHCLLEVVLTLFGTNLYLTSYVHYRQRNRKNPNAQSLPTDYQADREWSYNYLRLCMYGGDVPDIEVHKEFDALSDVIQ